MKFGYTLIELLITIGVSAIVVSVVGTVLAGIIRSNQRAQTLTQVARNGNAMFAILEEQIRSARTIECLSGGSTCPVITFFDKNNVKKEFGYHAGDAAICNNGYIYFRDFVGTAPVAKDKVTSDAKEQGVDVQNVTFSLTSVDKTSVAITATISNSRCNTLAKVSQTFSEYLVSKVD